MKKYLIPLVVATLATGVLFYGFSFTKDKDGAQAPVVGYKDATYIIDGKPVTLKDGTAYFGNEVLHDLNHDGREDVVFIITQTTAGTGTFYYVVAALNLPDGYKGSHGLFLGDRIAPQTTEMNREPGKEDVIVINYATRKPGEGFTVAPSVAKSIWLKFDASSMQFGEVEQNFEGEADPSKMTLQMKTWVWISATYKDGRKIIPKQPGQFTLSFTDKDRFSARTDCNSMGGSYTTDKNNISFSDIISTKMYCEGSQESEFASLLQNAEDYHFTSKGELVLDLKSNGGSVIFR